MSIFKSIANAFKNFFKKDPPQTVNEAVVNVNGQTFHMKRPTPPPPTGPIVAPQQPGPFSPQVQNRPAPSAPTISTGAAQVSGAAVGALATYTDEMVAAEFRTAQNAAERAAVYRAFASYGTGAGSVGEKARNYLLKNVFGGDVTSLNIFINEWNHVKAAQRPIYNPENRSFIYPDASQN